MLIIKKRLKTLIANILSLYLFSVPEAGVEPARPQWTQDFKSGASTDSATQALIYLSGKRDSNSRPRPWQGRALPTELFPQFLSGKRDSNSRPRPWQGRALPTELFPQFLFQKLRVFVATRQNKFLI